MKTFRPTQFEIAIKGPALMEVAASFGGIGDDGNEGDGIGDTNGAWAKSPGPKRDVMKKSELSREQKEYLEWHAKRNDAKMATIKQAAAR